MWQCWNVLMLDCVWHCSKVSIPVDKAIGLMEWVQSLGHEVPELGELQGLKKR